MIPFTDKQGRMVASGLAALSLAAVAAVAAVFFHYAVKTLAFLSPAIVPVVAGLFLAMFFKPYYLWWLKLVRNPSLALALMFASVLVPAGLLLWNYGAMAAVQIAGLVESGPERAAKAAAWFNETFPDAREYLQKFPLPAMDWTEIVRREVSRFASGSFGYMSSALNWLVSLVFFAYFVTRAPMRGEDWVREMAFLKKETRAFVAAQIDAFADIVVGFFQRQAVICLCEGLLYGALFSLCGLKSGFMIGFALGVLNIVPLFGTIVCMPIAVPLAYWGAGGGALKLSLVVASWLAVQILDGYLVTPRVQGGKTGLGYAGVIFSFFFWGAVFHSFAGLLLAIPLSAFCVVFWRALKSRYIKPIV